MTSINVTCIGGGHGLGHLLKILDKFDDINLTGIVSTTDNGGSTGRLRESCDTISWGDIRYCLSKLSNSNSTKSLLFEYRFDNLGDLSGHSLGNLMFCAVDSLCIRPTETVQVMREFLGIKTNILPMSDEVTQLVSSSGQTRYVGEVAVDDHAHQGIHELALTPKVKPSDEVLTNLANADILFLSPGSFYTSTLPSLLMEQVVETINQNPSLTIYFLTNVKEEFTNQQAQPTKQLAFIRKLGISKSIHTIIPEHRQCQQLEQCQPYTLAHLPIDSNGRHQTKPYQELLSNLIK